MSILDPSAIHHLVVHCSDTPDDEYLGAREIHDMHLGFGWHGVGYHRVIRRDGLVEAGRPDYWQGAHVFGHNEISLGVCLIGRQYFTDAQFDSLESVLRQWQLQYPDASICGHRDFSYTEKTCPNFDVTAWCLERGLENTGPVPS
ncbi:MAG: N-acetylmuramoyl-L-alanine amidase [Granulosicoccus sp.]